jgi:hypothetical protein
MTATFSTFCAGFAAQAAFQEATRYLTNKLLNKTMPKSPLFNFRISNIFVQTVSILVLFRLAQTRPSLSPIVLNACAAQIVVGTAYHIYSIIPCSWQSIKDPARLAVIAANIAFLALGIYGTKRYL